MLAECTARAGYIVASESRVGTAVGLPIPAAAQPLTGTEPIRRGAAETDSGYAPQKSCSRLIRAAARRGRAAVSAAPPKSLSCVPAAAVCVSFRSQSKGLERRPCPGGVLKRMRGISAFPPRRSRAQVLSVCGCWMRLPACGTALSCGMRRACVCLCIAAAFLAFGLRAAYEEQRLCAADLLRTMRRRSERSGLSAACASRRRLGVHRSFFRRRAELERSCLNVRTAARLSARRKCLGRIFRAAPLR